MLTASSYYNPYQNYNGKSPNYYSPPQYNPQYQEAGSSIYHPYTSKSHGLMGPVTVHIPRDVEVEIIEDGPSPGGRLNNQPRYPQYPQRQDYQPYYSQQAQRFPTPYQQPPSYTNNQQFYSNPNNNQNLWQNYGQQQYQNPPSHYQIGESEVPIKNNQPFNQADYGFETIAPPSSQHVNTYPQQGFSQEQQLEQENENHGDQQDYPLNSLPTNTYRPAQNTGYGDAALTSQQQEQYQQQQGYSQQQEEYSQLQQQQQSYPPQQEEYHQQPQQQQIQQGYPQQQEEYSQLQQQQLSYPPQQEEYSQLQQQQLSYPEQPEEYPQLQQQQQSYPQAQSQQQPQESFSQNDQQYYDENQENLIFTSNNEDNELQPTDQEPLLTTGPQNSELDQPVLPEEAAPIQENDYWETKAIVDQSDVDIDVIYEDAKRELKNIDASLAKENRDARSLNGRAALEAQGLLFVRHIDEIYDARDMELDNAARISLRFFRPSQSRFIGPAAKTIGSAFRRPLELLPKPMNAIQEIKGLNGDIKRDESDSGSHSVLSPLSSIMEKMGNFFDNSREKPSPGETIATYNGNNTEKTGFSNEQRISDSESSDDVADMIQHNDDVNEKGKKCSKDGQEITCSGLANASFIEANSLSDLSGDNLSINENHRSFTNHSEKPVLALLENNLDNGVKDMLQDSDEESYEDTQVHDIIWPIISSSNDGSIHEEKIPSDQTDGDVQKVEIDGTISSDFDASVHPHNFTWAEREIKHESTGFDKDRSALKESDEVPDDIHAIVEDNSIGIEPLFPIPAAVHKLEALENDTAGEFEEDKPVEGAESFIRLPGVLHEDWSTVVPVAAEGNSFEDVALKPVSPDNQDAFDFCLMEADKEIKSDAITNEAAGNKCINDARAQGLAGSQEAHRSLAQDHAASKEQNQMEGERLMLCASSQWELCRKERIDVANTVDAAKAAATNDVAIAQGAQFEQSSSMASCTSDIRSRSEVLRQKSDHAVENCKRQQGLL